MLYPLVLRLFFYSYGHRFAKESPHHLRSRTDIVDSFGNTQAFKGHRSLHKKKVQVTFSSKDIKGNFLGLTPHRPCHPHHPRLALMVSRKPTSIPTITSFQDFYFYVCLHYLSTVLYTTNSLHPDLTRQANCN